MPNAHVVRVRRKAGKHIDDAIIVVQLPVLHEQHDRHRGERLRERGEPIVGVGGGWRVRLEIGAAERRDCRRRRRSAARSRSPPEHRGRSYGANSRSMALLGASRRWFGGNHVGLMRCVCRELLHAASEATMNPLRRRERIIRGLRAVGWEAERIVRAQSMAPRRPVGYDQRLGELCHLEPHLLRACLLYRKKPLPEQQYECTRRSSDARQRRGTGARDQRPVDRGARAAMRRARPSCSRPPSWIPR